MPRLTKPIVAVAAVAALAAATLMGAVTPAVGAVEWRLHDCVASR